MDRVLTRSSVVWVAVLAGCAEANVDPSPVEVDVSTFEPGMIGDRLEEPEWLSELVRITARELPEPKPKKPKAKKKKKK